MLADFWQSWGSHIAAGAFWAVIHLVWFAVHIGKQK
jgi:hypothetical protein